MSARVAVARGKFAKGFDGTGRDVPAAYEVLELREALERVYKSDAHLVTYVLRGAERQPRINKPGLAYFDGVVETHALFCDVDNADHAEWTEELIAAAMRDYETLPVLATAGVYHTAHGRRIVQPLAAPIPSQRIEGYLKRWLLELDAAGLAVDWSCKDWTRHFRLPHVRRAGRDYRSPFVALERMVPVHLAPLPQAAPDATTPVRRGRPAPPPLLVWSSAVPLSWKGRVERIAPAVRAAVGNWHELFLAIAGALLARGVPHELVPALNRAISLATGVDTRTDDRERAARSTAERHAAGLPIAGFSSLQRGWPLVADALCAALATGAEARVRAHAAAAPPLPERSLAETTAAMRQALRSAPEGLMLIKAECGLGKTHEIRYVAKERAEKLHASEGATGLRAPLGSKTSISVDKNALAIEITRDLRRDGATVRRIYSPLSILREDGTPECRFHDTARLLVEGGQSVQREFCEGRGHSECEHYAECRARDGVDGPHNARITVGTHALLAELDAAAGSTGLLVIDEPPALLETSQLAVADFDVALGALGYFVATYADAMRPALLAFRGWTASTAPLETVVAPIEAVSGGAEHVATAELKMACRAARVAPDAERVEAIVGCLRGAQGEEHKGQAPPIQRMHAFAARRAVALAKELGTASRVLRDVHAALATQAPVAVRVEMRGGARVLLLTQARAELEDAVKREGSVVVADANAEVHLPVLAKVVGYTPPMHTFAAADGAPIARTLLRSGAVTRRRGLPGGQLVVGAGLVAAVRAAVAWAAEDVGARELALITFLPLEIALRAALQPEDASIARAWKEAGQDPDALAKVRAALAPVLAAWPGRILFGHYGAIRGLNGMKDVDALVTLGDPWANLGEICHEVAFLGLPGKWESRYEALCRAELEQAHGRIRAVHRTRPGRALHIGKVLPGGSGWREGAIEIRTPQGGRPPNEAAMRNNELVPTLARLGGIRAAARAVGCSHTALERYASGERAVPAAIAEELRRLDPGWQWAHAEGAQAGAWH